MKINYANYVVAGIKKNDPTTLKLRIMPANVFARWCDQFDNTRISDAVAEQRALEKSMKDYPECIATIETKQYLFKCFCID